MLESLSDKFDAIFKKLRGHGTVREGHLEETLREVRLALLEADVNLEVAKQFTEATQSNFEAVAKQTVNGAKKAKKSA